MRQNEHAPSREREVVYGYRASLAVVSARPRDVLEIVFAGEAPEELRETVRRAGAVEVPKRKASERELEHLVGSKHHEQLAVVTRPRVFAKASALEDALRATRGVAVALDRVRNPYNIGAILRTAAFFGATGAVLGSPAPHPALPPDAVRVAEGGAEKLMLCRTTDLATTLAKLRTRGVRVLGADGRADAYLFEQTCDGATVLVFGHEREGMSERVRAECDAVVAVPGSGAIESLNVAVAAGLFLGEAFRQRSIRPRV